MISTGNCHILWIDERAQEKPAVYTPDCDPEAGIRGMETGVEMGIGVPGEITWATVATKSNDCRISLATIATMIAHTINHCLTLDYFLVIHIVTMAAHREVGRRGGN